MSTRRSLPSPAPFPAAARQRPAVATLVLTLLATATVALVLLAPHPAAGAARVPASDPVAGAALVLGSDPAAGAALPSGPHEPPVEVVLTDPLPVGSVGPGSANQQFVVAAYPRLLGRAHDTGGLDYHLARLASGGDRSRETFAFALAFSPEGSRREVTRAYSDVLGRSPDPAGDAYWTAHLQGHGVVDLRVLLLASDEYRLGAGGNDGAWIDALYSTVLGRAPDDAGRSYWLGRIQGGVPRALVAASIYLSDESLGRRAQVLYVEVLGRAASAGDQAGAVAFIRATDERNLHARLVASDEAFEPFYQAQLPG